MDKFEETIKLLQRELVNYETQINMLSDDYSDVQFSFCNRVQANCWDYIYKLRMLDISLEQFQKLNEIDELLQTLEAKYYQILVRNSESLIGKKEKSIKSVKKIEDILGNS